MSQYRFRFANLSIFTIISFLIGTLILIRELLLINVKNYPFDDGLFIGRAESLIGDTEKTLGSTRGFNPLVKGQVYPFVLNFSNLLGLNPLVLVYCIFLATAILILILINKENTSLLFISSFIIFVFLDPSPFSAQASRIGREFLYEIIVMLSFALLIKLKFRFSDQKFRLRPPLVIATGSSIGLLMFLANNTREERPWIYLIWVTGFIWLIGKNRKTVLPIIFIAATTIIAYIVFNSYLRIYNENIFGVKLTSTTIEGEFPRLMSNLSSTNVKEKLNPYVSISESKRQIAYKNSPSFSLLKNYLEGEGKAWIQFGCENSQTCEDYANGWFHVALRVAIDEQGFWITQKSAQDFMSKVNDELELACTSRQITCNSALPIAKALGVTQITGEQIASSVNFLKQYVDRSVIGWNRGAQEHSAHEVMDERQWERWIFVVKSLPDSQEQYQNKYNHRISIFNPIYQVWVKIYLLINLVGILSFLYVLYALLLHRNRFGKNESIFVTTACFSLFIWFSRGVLLAINSATNFISIAENYALPGRVFLPIAYTLFFYVGVKIFLRTRSEQ
jgi:hypothetical protein